MTTTLRNRPVSWCLPLSLACALFSAEAPAQTEPMSAPALPSADRTQPAAQAQPAPEARPIVPVLKAGYTLSGKGEFSYECSGNVRCPSQGEEYKEQSGPGLAADLLFSVSPKLRLGFGALWVMTPNVETDWADYESGAEVSAFGILEGFFQTSPRFAFTARLQLGVLSQFPGDDHQRDIDDLRAGCNELQVATCSAGLGPFFGVTGGIGGGGAWLLPDGGALRVDLLVQAYAVDDLTLEMADAGSSGELTRTATGSRVWLMAGIEL
jgi:hypothetical protein